MVSGDTTRDAPQSPVMRGAPLVIAALAVLLYAAAVNAPFHPEASELIARETAQDWTKWPGLIGEAPVRALPLFTLTANWELTPASRAGFRVVQIALHGLNGVLLFFVLARLLPGRNAPAFALAGALLFAAHPAASEAVISALGRGALLGTTCMLAALWWYLRCVEDPARFVCKAGLVAALVIACGMTLSAAALAPVLLALETALNGRRGFEKRAGLHGVVWAATAAVLVVQAASGFPPIRWPGLADLGGAMGHGVISLFTGMDILVYHNAVFSAGQVTLGWLVFAALLLLSIALALLGRRIAAGLLWLTLTLLLSGLAPLGEPVADYRLYAPLAGLVLAAAPLLMALDARIHGGRHAAPGAVTRPLHTGLFALALLLVIGAGAVYSVSRALIWGDPAALWSQAAAAAPADPYPARRAAEALVENKRYEAAEKRLRAVLELDDDGARAWRLLGDALLGQDRPTEALEAYQEALWRDPRSAEAAMSAGIVLYQQARAAGNRNDLARAAAYLRRATDLDNRLPPQAYAAYGRTLAALGKWRAAGQAFDRAASLSPNEDYAEERKRVQRNLERLAGLRERLGDMEDQGSAEALKLRAEMQALQGRPVAAAYLLDEALRVDPEDQGAQALRERLRAP